jgi:Flp pilus assembly protein TadD
MALVASAGQENEARAELERLLDDPLAKDLSPVKRGQAHLELAALLGQSDDPSRAVEHFDIAEELLPLEKEVPFRRASYLRQQGDGAGARAALERYQELDQSQAATQQKAKETAEQLLKALRSAQGQANDNRLTEALASLDQVAETSRDDPRWRLLHAKILFSMNRAEEALYDLSRARNADPTNLEAPYIEAIVRRSLGQSEQAEDSLRSLLALAPDMAEAHYLLAVVLADRGELHQSVESYERALELGAKSPALLTGLEAVRKKLESEEN